MPKKDYERVIKNEFTGFFEFPVSYVRGGTSTGVIIWQDILPEDPRLKEELIKIIMGVPQDGVNKNNNQITGLGRITPTSNKAFFIKPIYEGQRLARFESTLAQMSAEHSVIDWSVNCGNMSSAIPLWAFEQGFLALTDNPQLEIFNTNTGIHTLSRINYCRTEGIMRSSIPGVHGLHPSIDLFLLDPSGSKTGLLFPTGHRRDNIEGIDVSCIDVAVPMVIVKATDLGKSGNESPIELMNDALLLSKLKNIWVKAGLKMGLTNKAGERMNQHELANSETIPKICMVSEPENQQSTISARYFTPQKAHSSMAVSGGCCLASACLIEGTVAHDIAKNISSYNHGEFLESEIKISNPAGVLDAKIIHSRNNNQIVIKSASCKRTAQLLMKGWVPIIGESPELANFLSLSVKE